MRSQPGGSVALILALATSLAIGCERTPTGEEAPLIGASARTREATKAFRHSGAGYAHEVASVAIDYSGMFYSAPGEITVLMKNLGRRAVAESRVRQILARSRRRGHVRIVVAPAKFSYEELDEWRDRIFQSWEAARQFVGLAIDERANKVEIEVLPQADQIQLRSRVIALGVPADAFSIVAGSRTRENADTTLLQRHRPIRGGLHFGPTGCTLGPLAKWGSDTVVLISSHCSELKWSADPSNTFLRQPYFGPAWGREIHDKNGWKCHFLWWDRCRKAEVAAYQVASVDLEQGESQRYAFGELVRPINRVSGPGLTLGSKKIDVANPLVIDGVAEDVIVGEAIDKIGTNTGWTFGEVTNACSQRLVYVANSVPVDHGRYVECMVLTDYNSKSGDSGGPVFIYNGGSSVTILGVNFGNYNPNGDAHAEHTGIFSKISYIRLDMSAAPLTFFPPAGGGGGGWQSHSATIIGPESVRPNASCTWSLTSTVADPSIEWRVDDEPVGTDASFTFAGAQSFRIDLVVWNVAAGAWTTASKNVSVSSEASECFIE